MALYEYRCDTDGTFDIHRPLGTAPESVACVACGASSRRVISAPMVLTSDRSAWSAAIAHADKSRYEPEVVSSLPSAGPGRRITTAQMTPALRSLPRP